REASTENAAAARLRAVGTRARAPRAAGRLGLGERADARLGSSAVRRQRTILGVAARVVSLGAVPTALCGCGDGTGVVEIAWTFVDRDGESIYPAGALSVTSRGDSCDFPGRTAGGTVPVDVRLELQI